MYKPVAETETLVLSDLPDNENNQDVMKIIPTKHGMSSFKIEQLIQICSAPKLMQSAFCAQFRTHRLVTIKQHKGLESNSR